MPKKNIMEPEPQQKSFSKEGNYVPFDQIMKQQEKDIWQAKSTQQKPKNTDG